MAKRKNAAAVALGRRGGKARMRTMTPAQRSEIARRAALASHGKLRRPQQLWVVLHPTDDNPKIILFSDPDRRKVHAWARKNQPDGIVTFLERDFWAKPSAYAGDFHREYGSDTNRQVEGLQAALQTLAEAEDDQ
ncbi:MAG TPA: hypothetical protein VGQ49_16790 [Bryobacteraceae bacterium]|jgi:hypothetical protein|nr:hypothetical protein [Bryobacteraceae bacterium]